MKFWELLAIWALGSHTSDWTALGNSIVQRRSHQAILNLVSPARGDGTSPSEKFTQDVREELIRDLARILEELDALGLPLAAVHVDTAICALKDAKALATQ